MRLPLAIALAAALLALSPALAALALTVEVPEDYGSVVASADLIIVGFPIDEGTSRLVGERAIVTDWQVFPQFVLKGSVPYEPLVVRTVGGTGGGMSTPGTSLRSRGTPYVFFLRATDEVCVPDGAAPDGEVVGGTSPCTVWRPVVEILGIQPVQRLTILSPLNRIVIGLADAEIVAALQEALAGSRFAVEFTAPLR